MKEPSTPQSTPTLSEQPPSGLRVSPRNKLLGLLLVILPIVLFPILLTGYAIFASISGISNASGYEMPVVGTITSLLGVLVAVIVALVIVGFPLGIYFLNKKEFISSKQFDPRSGKGNFSEVPDDIKGWNWGAAGLTWIWGVYHGVWISLLAFVPMIGWFLWIVLGIFGNEWAWRSQSWESVEQFHEAQRKWAPWGILMLLLSCVPIVLLIYAAITNMAEARNYIP